MIDFRYELNIDIDTILKNVTLKDTSTVDKERYRRLLMNAI